MRTIISSIVAIIIVAIVCLLCYVKFALPSVGAAEDIKVESTPEKIARGQYLANSVCACMDCHSARDWSKYSGPLVDSTLGQGGEEFNQKFGFPGQYFASNITPSALKNWTDGEILRAISSGVNKSGRALFPVMPHGSYGKMDREDLYALIAYIRTLKPIEKAIPVSKSDFPMNFIINILPKKAEFSKMPNPSDTVAYGAYIFNAASCNECHTKHVDGKPVEGMELAGGMEFPLISGGIISAANITPDKETGIGNMTEENFVKRFKMYADSTFKIPEIKKGDYNTMMPWMMYRGMTVGDLKSIFAYLKTVKPVKNSVIAFK